MHYPFSYEPPIPSPISIFPTDHPIYSLRATADASTPSTSTIPTPVQDRFVVQPTPITADESCPSFSSYSGQAVHPCQCMPSDPLDYFPFASKPCLNGEGAISASPSALLNPHRVMSQYPQHLSSAYSAAMATAQPCPCCYSGPSVFACHAHSLTLPRASHVYPHHRHSETTMNVLYDLTTSTTKSTQTSTTTMTVHQTGLASSVNACAALAPDPYHSYAPSRYTPHNPPLRSRLTSNGWQPQNTTSCQPFHSYVAPAPLPIIPVPSVPLYHPKPVHPLPEWTKKSSLVLDELFCEESLNTEPSTILAPPLPRGTDASSLGEYWNYGPPIAGATIEQLTDPQNGSCNGDDDDYDYDDDDDDDNGDNDDDEYDDDEDTDMEGDFEMEVCSGINPAMPGFHATPPAAFCGTFSSAAVPLSSSSLLCQPIPDFVQNQFRASAV
jgi:hypothetical protein